MALVLASSSPRREKLLHLIADEFSVDATPVEEVAPRALQVGEAVEVIARKKALAVSTRRPNDYVLAADTVVVYREQLINKARDELTMRKQLAMLCGETHQVWTGLALAWNAGIVDGAHAVTAVHIDRLPVAVLDAYAASGQWQGKAGGYGIQDKLLAPFARLQAGPWSNVVGLPLKLTQDLLARNRIPCHEPPTEDWIRDHNPF